jgi:hypothetical protein
MYKAVNSENIVMLINTGGFFSCCSIRLESIIDFYNQYKKLPSYVDSTIQFDFYKNDIEKRNNVDISSTYFEETINETIEMLDPIKFSNNDQFKNYKEIDYQNICKFVRKYFTPCQNIKKIIDKIQNEYHLDFENTCCLFFRGNDKILETLLPEYNHYVEKAKEIKTKNPNMKFIIQSDEIEFIKLMETIFVNDCIVFTPYIRTISKNSNLMNPVNPLLSKYFFAITIIMSKCKIVVCNTGNCSLWLALFRENSNNIIQLPESI